MVIAGFKSLSIKYLQRSLPGIDFYACLLEERWSQEYMELSPNERLENQNLKRDSRKNKQRTTVLCLNSFPSTSVTNSHFISWIGSCVGNYTRKLGATQVELFSQQDIWRQDHKSHGYMKSTRSLYADTL